MARNRLTWQNVTAPDYRSSMQGHALASRMFQDALGGLSDSLGSFTTQQRAAEQQAAEGAFLRQMAAASGDTAAQAELRRTLANNAQVGNEFLGKQLTDFRNAALTGDTTAEKLNQTRFDNVITQRDQRARDAVAPLQAEILRQEQLGNKDAVADLQRQYYAAIAGMSLEDQREFFEGNMSQRTSADNLVTAALNRTQTQQNIDHAGESQGWRRTDRAHDEAVHSLKLAGMASSTDPIEQRGAIINAGAQAELPASVVNRALAEIGQQQQGGGTGSTRSGGGIPSTPGTQQSGPATPGSGELHGEAERVLAQISSRTAAEQQPIGANTLASLADDSPMAAQYERQKQQYPSVFENLTLDEYSKLFEETRRENKGLPRGTVAELMLDNFTRGTSTWDRMPRWADPLRVAKTAGNFFVPDLGRSAGVDQEAVRQAAEVLNTQQGRKSARDTNTKLNSASSQLQTSQAALTQAEAQLEAAAQHYQQFRNPNVLIKAERDLELAELNLNQLIEGFKQDESLSELFIDPDDPARTITPQESRRRQDEVERKSAEVSQNRAFASATIPSVESRINQLQMELREAQMESNLNFDEPLELSNRISELRRTLDQENRKLNQLKEYLR